MNKDEPCRSKEQVAYDLMLDVMRLEGKIPKLRSSSHPNDPPRELMRDADRAYVLGLYAECILATNGVRRED